MKTADRRSFLKTSTALGAAAVGLTPAIARAAGKNPVACVLCVDDEAVIIGSFRKFLVLDDFAKKLIGPIDAIEPPAVGTTVRAGRPLIAIRPGRRRVRFNPPRVNSLSWVGRSTVMKYRCSLCEGACTIEPEGDSESTRGGMAW